MRKQPRLLILAVGLLAVKAIAQEIVVEPTNGRAPTAHHLTRPAAVEVKAVAAKPNKATQSAREPRGTAPKLARKITATQVAAKRRVPPTETAAAPPVPVTAKVDASALAPTLPKFPARPAWAMVDTRDARTLQSEIANALARDPTLAESTIQIDVKDDEVTLAGTANGTEARLQAERLAQSYAWNRKLVDHIEVVPDLSAQK